MDGGHGNRDVARAAVAGGRPGRAVPAAARGRPAPAVFAVSMYYSPSAAITFEDKVLTIDHDPVTNIDDVTDRTDYMIKILEKGL
jgi:hypothetical protein